MVRAESVAFLASVLRPSDVEGRVVLEVGSRVRGAALLVESMRPSRFVGIDIAAGPGVDLNLSIEDAPRDPRLGKGSVDGIICTEVLEHVRRWDVAVDAMLDLVRPGGWIFLTTPPWGTPYHEAPRDFWRFRENHWSEAFSGSGATVAVHGTSSFVRIPPSGFNRAAVSLQGFAWSIHRRRFARPGDGTTEKRLRMRISRLAARTVGPWVDAVRRGCP